MAEGILLSALSLLQKTFIDAAKGDREARKEQAQLLNAVAAAVGKLLVGTTALYDGLGKDSLRGWNGDIGYWQLFEACTELEAYFTRTLPGNKTVKRMQEWITNIRLHPAAIVSLYESLNADGTIREEKFENWEGRYTSIEAANHYRLQYLGFSNVCRDVQAVRKELTKIMAELKATAVMLESGTLGKLRPGS